MRHSGSNSGRQTISTFQSSTTTPSPGNCRRIHFCRYTPLILVFLGSLLSDALLAEPLVTETTYHYQVTGKTAEQIRENLNKRSPVVVNDRLFDASTERRVDWQLTLEERDKQQCRISEVTTRVDIVYTLPELKTGEATPAELIQLWSRYYDALLRHEKGHGSISISAARRIEASLIRLPSAKTCTELEIAADTLASRILTTYDYRDLRYDRDTGHGELEGAIFPPVKPL